MEKNINYVTADIFCNILLSAVTEIRHKKDGKLIFTISDDCEALENLINHDRNDIYSDFYTVSIKNRHDCTKILLQQAEDTLFSMKAYNERQVFLAVQTLVSYIRNHSYAIVKGRY